MVEMEKVASYLTVSEVADTLRVSGDTVRRWIREGTLPAIVIGKRDYRVSPSAVMSLVRDAR